MGNFNEYINTNNEEECVRTNTEKNTSRPTNDKLEEMISEYQKLSDNELMNEFMRLTLEKKRKGELDSRELNNVKNTILPFLNNEQKTHLEKIINMVENV